ncbi:trigger factor [Candidatus Kuenenbacteria bacterium CG11_big_fil_rev_8_21_14_0_20_37_9]|uniref:Trigger factor n=2 Tax=Candidatus Kueneniibacteriota TaxID=1752740 RepID=A0A2M6XS21_9BACT|nr:MAG: trigger factor [Candidatus Kuenenbacteria bacterium CG1_02_38_13]PIR05374.1 MAG: trigger factor [Candidatus Kuenenbacteria bacterium CG11_big_fil_rev_8_21_14_0_20_37_9]PIU10369.1 MAG: trigger factor [Candidatus Kuenenbacteria bacterium CG08_land_8_20_14_0_20_37_23]
MVKNILNKIQIIDKIKAIINWKIIMELKTEIKPKALVEFSVSVLPAEYNKYLKKAAEKISRDIKIAGFRPGKAPYNIIKARVGEGEIMNEALKEIITHTFIEAVEQEKIDTIGQPEINVRKMAPGENLEYTATVTILPCVTLPELTDIEIEKKDIGIEYKEIKHTLDYLARSRAKEILKNRAADDKDLVKLDYNISIAGVQQDGGQQKNFSVYLGEKHMVPGFEENIIGLKAGDKKRFKAIFPKNYFQKNFAGKECQFDIKIKQVFQLDIPDINDEFAKAIGDFKNLDELKKQIEDNIKQEKLAKQERKLENDMFDKLIGKTEFGEISDKLIENEINMMINEIKSDLEIKGLQFNTWLGNMEKKEEDLKKDFRPKAIRRIKSALIIREVAKKEKIEANDNDIKEEIKKLEDLYHDNIETLDRLKSHEYYDYIVNSLTNKKVVDYLKSKITQK